jgi:hypothetical protein
MSMMTERCISGNGRLPIQAIAIGAKVEEAGYSVDRKDRRIQTQLVCRR